jgi:FkbM family methyltransferase
VFFKDKTHAFIANMGSIDGVMVDGGLEFYQGGLAEWEHTTFLIFRALIRPDMVYVGFGEWIGPTILYSSQLAKASYGFEPDIIAFRSLALNAKANQCFGDRLKVFPLCIYMSSGEFALTNARGRSMAAIEDSGYTSVGSVVSVQCDTLERVLTNHSLMNENLFLKVDTEGAEALLVPSLIQLVRKLKYKPTWFISKHKNKRYSELGVQQGFSDLISLYKCHRYAPASHQTFLTNEQLLSFSLSALPKIEDSTISDTESNPDLILVDEDCAVVDKRIHDVARFFV